MSMVAMVPRSFSPAMDSGATAAQPEYRKTISSMGIIIAKKLPVVSSAVARSYPSPPALTSNLLTIRPS